MMSLTRFLVFLSFLTLSGCSLAQSIGPARVLIYSATAGFRHDSIPTAIQALKSKGASINVGFDATEDRGQFTDTTLGTYDALLFLSTTGEGALSVNRMSGCQNDVEVECPTSSR